MPPMLLGRLLGKKVILNYGAVRLTIISPTGVRRCLQIRKADAIVSPSGYLMFGGHLPGSV